MMDFSKVTEYLHSPVNSLTKEDVAIIEEFLSTEEGQEYQKFISNFDKSFSVVLNSRNENQNHKEPCKFPTESLLRLAQEKLLKGSKEFEEAKSHILQCDSCNKAFSVVRTMIIEELEESENLILNQQKSFFSTDLFLIVFIYLNICLSFFTILPVSIILIPLFIVARMWVFDFSHENIMSKRESLKEGVPITVIRKQMQYNPYIYSFFNIISILCTKLFFKIPSDSTLLTINQIDRYLSNFSFYQEPFDSLLFIVFTPVTIEITLMLMFYSFSENKSKEFAPNSFRNRLSILLQKKHVEKNISEYLLLNISIYLSIYLSFFTILPVSITLTVLFYFFRIISTSKNKFLLENESLKVGVPVENLKKSNNLLLYLLFLFNITVVLYTKFFFKVPDESILLTINHIYKLSIFSIEAPFNSFLFIYFLVTAFEASTTVMMFAYNIPFTKNMFNSKLTSKEWNTILNSENKKSDVIIGLLACFVILVTSFLLSYLSIFLTFKFIPSLIIGIFINPISIEFIIMSITQLFLYLIVCIVLSYLLVISIRINKNLIGTV